MILLDTLLVGGLKFVLRRVADAVDAQLNDEGGLREELLATQMRFELGEIDEAEFRRREAELLQRIRELREQRQPAEGSAAGPGRYQVETVEAAFEDREEPAPPASPARRG